MAKKILLPVLPSDRFYDAVVAAGDIVGSEGGLITFLFTQVRPPEEVYSDDASGHPSDVDVAMDSGELVDHDGWRSKQVAALEDARAILTERGVRESQIDYQFADFADHVSSAQAIADEAAAGAYDLVVLARGYFQEEVLDEDSEPRDITAALRSDVGDEVKVLVT